VLFRSHCSSRHRVSHQAKGLHHSLRLHWLPIKSRIPYKLCILVHLVHTGQRPAYMTEMVELTATSSSPSDLRSASHLLYRKPALKTNYSVPLCSVLEVILCNEDIADVFTRTRLSAITSRMQRLSGWRVGFWICRWQVQIPALTLLRRL